MDDASSVFDATVLTGPVANFPVADSFNRALERDLSTGDIPHVFVGSVVWQVPIGSGPEVSAWRACRRAAARLGYRGDRHAPVGHSAGRDAGDELQRVRRLRHAASESRRRSRRCRRRSRTTARWFNTEAFAIAPQFTLGSSSRNPVRGPGYSNVDLAIARRFALPRHHGGHRTSLEIRVEAFNLTNTPPLGAPNTRRGNPRLRGDHVRRGSPRPAARRQGHVLTLDASRRAAEARS